MNQVKLNWQIALIVAIGTTLRVLFAIYHKPWNQAPDMLAWELLLEEAIMNGSLRYDQLIHYPHEGGTVLLSLIALPFKLFGFKSSLAASALIVDTFSRFIQLSVVRHLCSRKVFYVFAIWTLLATASIFPWSVINFGLHSLSSFFPFIAVYLAINYQVNSTNNLNKGWLIGSLFGTAIWFSYSNVVLIPILLWHIYSNRKNLNHVVQTVSLFGLIIAMHIIVRTVFDPGFHLTQFSGSTIRGLSYSYLGELSTYLRLITVYVLSLPGSSMIPAIFDLSSIIGRSIWNAIHLIAFGVLIANFKQTAKPYVIAILSIILLFLGLYALSPFYDSQIDREQIVYYRHFGYITPSIALVTFISLLSVQRTWLAVLLYIGLGAFGTLEYLSRVPNQNVAVKETGWIIGTKIGDDPKRVKDLANHVSDPHEFMCGYGWGVAASLFEGEIDEKRVTAKFKTILEGLSPLHQPSFVEGAKFAFTLEGNQKLNQKYLYIIEDTYETSAN